MKRKLEISLLIFLLLGFGAVTVGLFLPKAPLIPLFSQYLFFCVAVQALRKAPVSFMMTGFSTLFGVFCFSQVSQNQTPALPVLILVLWGSTFLLYFHQERLNKIHLKGTEKNDEFLKKSRVLKQEITYYETRKVELEQNAARRRHLSLAARELGSLLDPVAIQEKLIQTANSLFPDKPAHLNYGQNPDAVDRYVIQKRQPLMVPGDFMKGNPLMAVPIMAQHSVAGILRVGGHPGPAFGRDDIRILDSLASLASLALDNCLLFQQVQDSALRDNLTGLLTHKAFQDSLDANLLEASRYNQSVSIILTDVDHFKSINDNYGHQTGDQVLQGFAHVLARNVRDVDIVARWGGEEFIVLLYQTSHEVAFKMAEQIRVDLEHQRFGSGKQVIQITGSFGVATFPEDAASAQQLVRQADQRLYAAKKGGRNIVIGKAA